MAVDTVARVLALANGGGGQTGGGVMQFNKKSDFPKIGDPAYVYLDKSTGFAYYWDATKREYIKTSVLLSKTVADDFEYKQGYEYEITAPGTGYQIDDILATSIYNEFVKVTAIDASGAIEKVKYTRIGAASPSGSGATITATLSDDVFIIPTSHWGKEDNAIYAITNDAGAQVEFLEKDDILVKFNMGDDNIYYRFEYDPEEGIIIQEGSEIKGGGDAKLERDVKANTAAGAINAGDTILTDTTFTEFVEKLLIKEVAPTTTMSATGTGVKEIGTTVANPTITLNITGVGTGTPTSISFYEGSTLLGTQTYVSGTNTYRHNYSGNITTDTTFKATLNYNKSDGTGAKVDKTASYQFVKASYFGAVSSLTPTEAEVMALTKDIKNTRAATKTITLTDQRTCYAYPANFGSTASGALTSIKDANNFEYLASYTHTTPTIDGVQYHLYVLNDPVTASGFKQVYS